MNSIFNQSSPSVVLTVDLDYVDLQARAVFLLEKRDGSDPDIKRASWHCSVGDFGIPDSRSEHIWNSIHFANEPPQGFLDWLRSSLEDIPEGQVLWLYLIPSCGYLDLVPWESLLHSLGRPILRRPLLAEPKARENHSILDVALCGSVPVAKGALPIIEMLLLVAKQIRGSGARRMRLHVFTDHMNFAELKDRATAELGIDQQLPADIQIHDPATATEYQAPRATTVVSETAGRVRNPWLLWIREALRGQGVDVVHFVSHGYFAADRGALALAESPTQNTDHRIARFVGAAELKTFLTHVGAWSIAITAPPHNYSEVGLRRLASEIARRRPGPVLYHSLERDPDGEALKRGYQFLYGTAPSVPPVSDALNMSCAPEQVEAPEAARAIEAQIYGHAAIRMIEPDTRLASVFESEEPVPAWLAASQRFLEQMNVEITQLSSTPIEESSTDQNQARIAGLTGMLAQFQDVVARSQQRDAGGSP